MPIFVRHKSIGPHRQVPKACSRLHQRHTRHGFEECQTARRCEGILLKSIDEGVETRCGAKGRQGVFTIRQNASAHRMPLARACRVVRQRSVTGWREGNLAAHQFRPSRREEQSRPGAAGLTRQNNALAGDALGLKAFQQRFEPGNALVELARARLCREIPL